jgi:zinc protease
LNNYTTWTLPNGLGVLFVHNPNIKSAVLNLLYKVGSKHEIKERTGFAHLFEHLMFEGSVDIPHFDAPLQKVGGSNNAFTSTDITNYYIHVPAQGLNTAMWLESNRMKELDIDQKKLDIQKGVVIEEYHQNYTNQPYGDLFHELRSLCYKDHGYSWPTIGSTPEHVREASLSEVQAFYTRYYCPENAFLVIVAPQTESEIKAMINHWFGDISRTFLPHADRPLDNKEVLVKEKTVHKPIQVPVCVFAVHVPALFHPHFVYFELFAEIFGNGKTSRLHKALVETGLCTDAFAGLTSEMDEGLMYVPLFHGELNDPEHIRKAFLAQVESVLGANEPSEEEWLKAKNQWLLDWEMHKISPLKQAELLAKFGAHNALDLLHNLPELVKEASWTKVKEVLLTTLDTKNWFQLNYLKED